MTTGTLTMLGALEVVRLLRPINCQTYITLHYITEGTQWLTIYTNIGLKLTLQHYLQQSYMQNNVNKCLCTTFDE